MRWIFLVFVFVCSVARAQDKEVQNIQRQIAFVARSSDNVNVEALERYLSESNFELLPVIPEGTELPGIMQEIFPKARAFPKLFQLDSSEFSPCNNLVLGLVEGGSEVDATTLRQLEETLRQAQMDAGITVLGVDGEGNHQSDMTYPTGQASEDAFEKGVYSPQARDLAYTHEGSNNLIAILDTGVTTDLGDVGDLATVISGFQLDLLEFDTTPQDVYEDYMNGSYFNKGHGTPIALIAHTVATQAEILPVRVCNEEGQCPTTKVVVGVCYAVNVATMQEKKLIVNMSFSAKLPPGFAPKDTLLYQLLRSVVSSERLVATEVGNKGLDPNPRYPAAFTNEGLDGLVSTSALEPYGQGSWSYVPAYYSTRGNYIDVAALGSNLFVGRYIVGDNNYKGGYSGSSFATPWVTGALSLMLEANAQRLSSSRPLLTAWELEYCLSSTTQPPMPPVISQLEVGQGMIDIKAAVECVRDFVKP